MALTEGTAKNVGTPSSARSHKLATALQAILIISAILSFTQLDAFTPISTSLLLDAWLLITGALVFFTNKHRRTRHVIILVVYLAVVIVFASLSTNSTLSDTAQAYRWVVYMIALVAIAGKELFSSSSITRFGRTLIYLAFLKYFLAKVVFNATERPGLFIENNFELALFCGIAIILIRINGRQELATVFTLTAITLLSGSRSGVVTLAIVWAFLILSSKLSKVTKALLVSIATPAIAALVFYIFNARYIEDGGNIDRLNFLQHFLYNVESWNLINWLFGTTPMTPLDTATCGSLAYYSELFSIKADGTCYSVILHAFLLRVVFDAGIVGLAFCTLAPISSMRAMTNDWMYIGALVSIAIVNSFSVSGFNNPYTIIPIIAAATLPIGQSGKNSISQRRYLPSKSGIII